MYGNGNYHNHGCGYGNYNDYYNNNYFNSYDNNSYYYGPRTTTAATGRVTSQPTLASRYIAAVEKETAKPFESTKGRDNNPYLQNKTALDRNTLNITPAREAQQKEPVKQINAREERPNNNNEKSLETPNKLNNEKAIYDRWGNQAAPDIKQKTDNVQPKQEQREEKTKPAYKQEKEPSIAPREEKNNSNEKTQKQELQLQREDKLKPRNEESKYQQVRPRQEQAEFNNERSKKDERKEMNEPGNYGSQKSSQPFSPNVDSKVSINGGGGKINHGGGSNNNGANSNRSSNSSNDSRRQGR